MKTPVAKKRKSATVRTRVPHDVDVKRGPGGTVEMIEFEAYSRNAAAPTIYVNKVNGIYRVDSTLIKVCFGRQSPGPGGAPSTEEAVNLLWEPHKWLEAGDLFRWAIKQFADGALRHAIPDDGGGRRPMTQ